MTKTKQSDAASRGILEGPLLPAIIAFVLPLIATSVLQLLYNAADIIVVGQFVGKEAVAAVGSTTSLVHLFTNVATSLATGASMCIAVRLGSGDKKESFHLTHTAIAAAAVIGIFLGIIGFFSASTLLRWMKTDPTVLDMSTLYLKIYFCGMPALLLYNLASAVIRTDGDTRRPLLYLAVSGLVNVVLNVLLVWLFHMGVAGVAIATVASEILSALLSIRRLTKLPQEHPCRLSLSKLRFYPGSFATILRAGLPVAIHGLMFNMANIVLQSNINVYGIDAVSGSSAAASIEGFTYVSMNAFAQATVIFVGQNRGAGQWDRIKKIIFTDLALVSFVGLFLSCLSVALARPLLAIYLGAEQQAISYGVTRLLWVVLPYFLCGVMDTLVGALQGLGSSFAPMVIAVFGVCGTRFLWFYTLYPLLCRLFVGDPHMQMGMLFLSYPVSWLLTLSIQGIDLFHLYRKKVALALLNTRKG